MSIEWSESEQAAGLSLRVVAELRDLTQDGPAEGGGAGATTGYRDEDEGPFLVRHVHGPPLDIGRLPLGERNVLEACSGASREDEAGREPRRDPNHSSSVYERARYVGRPAEGPGHARQVCSA